jgi:chromosome segregation ATPase
MTTLNQTLECLLDGIGQATGEAIRTEINTLLGMPNVDITALSAAVAQIQSILDADPNQPGYQTAQNIITQLVALGNRLDALENSTVVAQLQVLVGNINAALATETAERQAADQALQDTIAGLTAQLDNLANQVSVINQTGPECDCAAIAAQITALQNDIGNLTGTDAAQAAQIAALQNSIAEVAGSVATATAAAQAATAAAAAASAQAAAAAVAAANAATAVAALDERENNRHTGHGNRLNDLESFKAGVEAIDCVALIARFRTNVAAGLAA